MTTAGRPTYYSKIGSTNSNLGIRSNHVSGKDQTAHTKLKFRQAGQNNPDDINKRHLKDELNTKEKEVSGDSIKLNLLTDDNDKNKNNGEIKGKDNFKLLTNISDVKIDDSNKYDDTDFNDDDSDRDLDTSSEEEEDQDDDDDDDEMLLQAELERIKAERLSNQLKKEQEEKNLQEKLEREGALKGNPLISISKDDSAKLKRRWNDDVVFRNQAKDEPVHKKRFINDTIRNDFHRLFLNRYFK